MGCYIIFISIIKLIPIINASSIIGAYDIGYGGLDHIFASGGRDVNLLVLDTEVYSNTGGQMLKSTPRGAIKTVLPQVASRRAKKDLGLMAEHGNVYVSSVAYGGSG